MKMWYGLASKNAIEQRRQEARSLEQVWSWHCGYLDIVSK